MALERMMELARSKRQPTRMSSVATTATVIRRLIENDRMSFLKRVSVPAYRVNNLGVAGGVQLASKTGNVYLDHVAESLPIEVVEMFEQFRFRNDSTAPVCQVLNYSVFHASQNDVATVASNCPIGGIDFKCAHTDRGSTLPFSPADQCLNARDEFAEVERLA